MCMVFGPGGVQDTQSVIQLTKHGYSVVLKMPSGVLRSLHGDGTGLRDISFPVCALGFQGHLNATL